MKPSLLAFALGPFLVFSSPAATVQWDGGDTLFNFWGSANNWNPNGVPSAGDALVFPAGLAVGDRTAANSFGAGTGFASMRIEDINYTIAGNAWTVSQFVELAAGQGSSSVNTAVALGASPVQFRCSGSRTVLNFGGAIDLAGRTLELEANPGSFKFTGNITDSGSGIIAKNGTGEAEFAAGTSVSATGGIQVNAGRVAMHGAGSGSIVVNPGGTLVGTGSSASLFVSGTMSPGGNTGFTRGTYTSAGTVQFFATSVFTADLGNAGGTSDLLNAGGSVTIASGAQLNVTLPSPMLLKPGDSFTILRKTSANAITGQFTNAPEGGILSVGRVDFEVSYSGESGNDLVLTVTEVGPSGVTRTWDGGGNNDLWSTADNWAGNIAPESGDSLIFPAGAARPDPVNDFPADLPLADLTIASGAYRFSGNRFRWIGNIASTPNDSDLEFDLPVLVDSNYTQATGTVVHSGSRRLILQGALTPVGSATLFVRQETAGGGVTVESPFSMASSLVASVNLSSTAIEWRPISASGALAFLALGGSQEIGGTGTFSASNLWVGHVEPFFAGLFGSFPTTSLELGGGSKFAQDIVVAAGCSISSEPGQSLQLFSDAIDFRGSGSVATGAGGTFEFRVLGVTVAAAATVDFGASMIVGDPGFSFAIGAGAVCQVKEIGSPISQVDGFLSGGGRLGIGLATNIDSLAVSGNSTLELSATDSGSPDMNVTLGAAGSPGTVGHLTGRGQCGDIARAGPGGSVSPGTAAAPYGRITCKRFAAASIAVNLQVAGTVPGVSMDQLEILLEANYSGFFLPNLDFVNGYAPQPLEELVVFRHGPGASLNGISFGAVQAIVFGQKWLIYTAGGDGNDYAFQKRAVDLPGTGPAVGLPPAHLVIQNPQTGAGLFEQFARGLQGIIYVLEASDNLVQWNEVQRINTSFGNSFTTDFVPATFGYSFPVNVKTQPKRFFRLRPL